MLLGNSLGIKVVSLHKFYKFWDLISLDKALRIVNFHLKEMRSFFPFNGFQSIFLLCIQVFLYFTTRKMNKVFIFEIFCIFRISYTWYLWAEVRILVGHSGHLAAQFTQRCKIMWLMLHEVSFPSVWFLQRALTSLPKDEC